MFSCFNFWQLPVKYISIKTTKSAYFFIHNFLMITISEAVQYTMFFLSSVLPSASMLRYRKNNKNCFLVRLWPSFFFTHVAEFRFSLALVLPICLCKIPHRLSRCTRIVSLHTGSSAAEILRVEDQRLYPGCCFLWPHVLVWTYFSIFPQKRRVWI